MEAHAAGLKPNEFWALTPHEVALVVRGHGKRQEHWLEVAAWHAAHILNMVSKRRIRPRDLLKGRASGAEADAIKADVRERWLFSPRET